MSKSIAVSEALVAEFIRANLPERLGQSLRFLSVGDFSTWEVGGDYILRLAFDEGGDAQLRREARLLPRLAKRLPVAIPEPTLFGPVGSRYLAIGYSKVRGIDGEVHRPDHRAWPALARQLAELFNALHSTDTREPLFADLEKRDLSAPEDPFAAFAAYRDLIRQRTPELVNEHLDAYLQGEVEIPPPGRRHVLSHADLKGEHVLLDDGGQRLIGVIDWGDLCLTDPADDLSGLGIWLGEEFVRMVAASYDAPDRYELVGRGLFMHRVYMLEGLGQCLAGENLWPLDLVRVQIEWLFR